MFHRWPALLLVLVVSAMMPKQAAGQEAQAPPQHSVGKLGKSWPNPFNPDVNTPFTVGDGNCPSGETHVVTVRILNILAQPVVFPILKGQAATSTSSSSSSMNGARLSNLRLGCGDYLAYWDGWLVGHTHEAASGTYIVQIIVDGKVTNSTRIYYRK